MKKSLLLFTVLFSGCLSTKVLPLKGSYPQPPIITGSSKSFDQVWDKTIDYFAQHGIPIKIIDKSSGLIVSDKTQLTWSFEKNDGSLYLPSAFVVLEKILDNMHEKPFSPEIVTGEWNVRIKPDANGSSVNVNLYNIEATYGKYYYSNYTHTAIQPVTVKGKTTGNFEKSFENEIR